jgi:hypothetical protein
MLEGKCSEFLNSASGLSGQFNNRRLYYYKEDKAVLLHAMKALGGR